MTLDSAGWTPQSVLRPQYLKAGTKPTGRVELKRLDEQLGRLKKADKWAAAVELLEGARRRELEPSKLLTFNVVLGTLAVHRQWRDALEFFSLYAQRGLFADIVSVGSLLGALAVRGSPWWLGVACFSRLRHTGLRVTSLVKNACMKLAAIGGQWRRVRQSLADYAGEGLLPNRSSFNHVLGCCQHGGKWADAIQLVRLLRAAFLSADAMSYASALHALRTAKKWRSSVWALADMSTKALQPCFFEFNIVLQACDQASQDSDIVGRILESMESALVAINAQTFNHVIAMCAGSERWRRGCYYLGRMRRSGIRYTGPSYLHKVSCSRRSSWELMLTALASSADDGVVSDRVLYSSVLKFLRWPLAMRVLSSIFAAGHKCASPTYNQIMLRSQGDGWTTALDLHSEMKASAMRVCEISRTSLVTSCCSNGKPDLTSVGDNMRQHGSRWGLLVEYLSELHQASTPRCLQMYNSVIGELGNCEEWRCALGLLRELKHSKLEPWMSTYAQALRTCTEEGHCANLFEHYTAADEPQRSLVFLLALQWLESEDMLDDRLFTLSSQLLWTWGKEIDGSVKSPPVQSLDRGSEIWDDSTGPAPHVIEERKHVLAVWKPPGWTVTVNDPFASAASPRWGAMHAARVPSNAYALPAWISYTLADRSAVAQDPQVQFGVLHRLDRGTTGPVLCAKTYQGYLQARLHFAARRIRKVYVCLVRGHVDLEEPWVIKAPLDTVGSPGNWRSQVCMSGRPACTEVV
eukprot:TRINITY_DN8499_c0_g6_i1.p1 TRINITY_DN8499_c0_g6~~TRINITY_DN8499_c0_g6_i1.p1  ORF type:complete len:749 (-),score=64.36 TRINITY_DN8499_c0_g6_i1:37-2283(-)